VNEEAHLADGIRLDRKVTAEVACIGARLGEHGQLTAYLDAAEICLAGLRNGSAEDRLVAAGVLDRLSLKISYLARTEYLRQRDGALGGRSADGPSWSELTKLVERTPAERNAERARLERAIRRYVEEEDAQRWLNFEMNPLTQMVPGDPDALEREKGRPDG